jgi:hypothetical protein
MMGTHISANFGGNPDKEFEYKGSLTDPATLVEPVDL